MISIYVSECMRREEAVFIGGVMRFEMIMKESRC
jgi:hypothetical protein